MLLCVMVLQIKSVECEKMESMEILDKISRMRYARYYNIIGNVGYVSNREILISTTKKVFKASAIIIYHNKIKIINIDRSEIYDIENELIIDIQ